MSDRKKLIAEINRLKQEKNAVILVHNYQRPEIFEVADFVGDSLGLCLKARDTSADVIIFCGVNFMAETAKILNPGKRVFVPHAGAGCAMSDMINADELLAFKKSHGNIPIVCYVNTTAEVKAVSDICCTSSNAVQVVKSLPDKKIIFVPDQNLAQYVSTQISGKEIIAWNGYCPVHHFIDAGFVSDVRRDYPDAKIIAHPEAKPQVIALSDYVSSTSGMAERARSDSADRFFILTECGMVERLKSEVPGKEFFGLCNICFDMKKNTLERVCESLTGEKNEVIIDSALVKNARRAIDRMLSITN